MLRGRRGPLGGVPDVLDLCAGGPAADGRSLLCGHFLAEDRPEEALDELRPFLDRQDCRPAGTMPA
ncbi:MAG TPA: hypothetical protein VEZ42_10920 [Pseudonocardia sp.]|nr:hypothetical protein [Pseudonocardia sp.]